MESTAEPSVPIGLLNQELLPLIWELGLSIELQDSPLLSTPPDDDVIVSPEQSASSWLY